MNTYTVIHENSVEMGLEAGYIDNLAMAQAAVMASAAPRGAKPRTKMSLVKRGHEYFEMVVITILNVKHNPIGYAVVLAEQAAKPHSVHHIMGGQQQFCRGCGYGLFYDVGRSLDYYNLQCAQCELSSRTLTETGASA